jgi:hypothetical protein
MKPLRMLLVFLAAALAAPVIAQDSGTTNMDILLQKVKADKKLLVATNMNLTDAEGKAFWPIYASYQNDLQQINGRLKNAILAYADAYNKGAISNETAKKLLTESLSIDESEVKLNQSYATKLEAVIPEAKVARYIQIERKIRAAVRYELASEIPLVK